MQNRVMIITGTRKGIGEYLAEYYLQNNFIIAGCSRGEGNIKNNNYIHYRLDVSDESAVSKMVKNIAKKFDRIDILINNAGIASMNHMVLTPTKSVRKIMETNFIGTFNFTREVSKIMIKHKWGRIVNVSTVAVPLRLEGESAYIASKSAIEGFTKAIAKELAPFNITVNVLGLAPLMTDLIKSVPKEKIENLLNMMAIKRLAEYRDVSNGINFFIEEESDYVTGQVIYLGGVG